MSEQDIIQAFKEAAIEIEKLRRENRVLKAKTEAMEKRIEEYQLFSTHHGVIFAMTEVMKAGSEAEKKTREI